MNTVLLRKERILRMAPAIAGLAALLAWPELSLALQDGARPRDFGSLYALVGLPASIALVPFLTLLPFPRRVLEYERALPIETRSVLAVRLLATWIALALPWVVLLALLALLRPPGVLAADVALVGLAALAATGIVLLWLFGCFASRTELTLAQMGLVAIPVPGILLLPAFVPLPWIALGYGVAAVSLLGLLAGPRSYLRSAAPPAPVPVRVRERPVDSSEGRVAAGRLDPLRWTLLRSTVLRPRLLPVLVLLVAAPACTSGAGVHLAVWIPIVMIVTAGRIGLGILRGVGALPLGRERVLRYVALPALAAHLVGFGIWHCRPLEYMFFVPLDHGVRVAWVSEESLGNEPAYGPQLLVPPELCVWTAASEPLRVEAPWGEVHEPHPHPLLRGSTLRAVNPYGVSEQSSLRFLTWQLSRALDAVYGAKLGAQEVQARWFAELDPAAPVSMLRSHFREHTPWEELGAPLRHPARDLGYLLLVALGLWLVAMLWVLRPNVPGGTRAAWWRRRTRDWTLIAGAFALVLIAFLAEAEDGVLLPVVSATLRARLDGLLGGSALGWLALDLAALLASYRLLAWRIARIEVPQPVPYGWTGKTVPVF